MFVYAKSASTNIVFLVLTTFCHAQHNAFIVVPVADMFLEKPSTNNPELECASDHVPEHALRVHQLLYNTPVSILRTEGSYVLVHQDEAYCSHVFPHHCAEMWTKKRNIILFAELSHATKRMCFPDSDSPAQTIVLIEPFEDGKTMYSAGTRFTLKETTGSHFIVTYYDQIRKKCGLLHIPRYLAQLSLPLIKNITLHDKQQRQKNYVTLLKKWTSSTGGKVPYVWGGSSYCKRTRCNISEKQCSHGKKIYYYEDLLQPHTGFDCSSLILRASQIAGIPNYCKNTRTLKECLTRCRNYKELQNGDIIFIPGHVMIVSDKKNNLIIEAAGYGRGYGRVQETKLSDFFKNTTTYQQLFHALARKTKITIVNKDQKDFKEYATADIVILSFASIWNAPSPLEFSA